MRRITVLTLVIMLAMVSYGYCANYNNWGNTDLNPLLGRELPYDLVYNGVGRSGVSTEVVTLTTTLTPTMSVALVDVATKTLTVADGVPGQVLIIIGKDASDTGTLTLTATTKTGWTSGAIDTVRDVVVLYFVDSTYGWIVIGTNSVTIT